MSDWTIFSLAAVVFVIYILREALKEKTRIEREIFEEKQQWAADLRHFDRTGEWPIRPKK